MEKRTPHYDLTAVQVIVADQASRPFTATALRGGLELGLSEPEMRLERCGSWFLHFPAAIFTSQ